MTTRSAQIGSLLTMLAAVVGCSQSSLPFGSGPNSTIDSPAQLGDNPRNQLLKRIQGQDNADKLKTLLEIIQYDSDRVIRRDAISYLASQGAEAQSLAEPLAQLVLHEADPSIVDDVQRALVDIDANVEPFLLYAASNATDDRLLLIIETLGQTRASSPKTFEFLLQQLLSTNSERLIATCRALERIGPAAASTLPMLISVAERPRVSLAGTNDGGRAFREGRDSTHAAIRAILAIGADQSAVPVLTDCLAMEPSLAATAAEALADIGPAAASALPALQQVILRDDHGGRDIKTKLAREAASKAVTDIAADND